MMCCLKTHVRWRKEKISVHLWFYFQDKKFSVFCFGFYVFFWSSNFMWFSLLHFVYVWFEVCLMLFWKTFRGQLEIGKNLLNFSIFGGFCNKICESQVMGRTNYKSLNKFAKIWKYVSIKTSQREQKQTTCRSNAFFEIANSAWKNLPKWQTKLKQKNPYRMEVKKTTLILAVVANKKLKQTESSISHIQQREVK